jgi:sulfoxide reductase heme-binding subunit YedZ
VPPAQTARLQRRLLTHHLLLFLANAACIAALYATRPYKDVLTRASFATAYPALLLLAATLWLGPWKLLRGQRLPVSSDLRRDVGIWAGILAVLHTGVGQCVHLRGRPWLYYIYDHPERHFLPLRHDLFGFSNYTGAAATLLALALLATSSDYALRRLGTPAWKRLQRWNYALFALVACHAIGYQTIEKQHLPFVLTVAATLAVTVALQGMGYRLRRGKRQADAR